MVTDSPGSTSLRTQKRLCPLHVIARSAAAGQSVTPAAVHGRKQRLRQIRKASQICPNSSQLAKFPCGENGLPHLGDTSCASFAPAFPEENPGLKSLRCIAFSGPHRCAPVPILHWLAMTCRRQWRVCGCKDLPHCHCEERSGGTIRTLCGRA